MKTVFASSPTTQQQRAADIILSCVHCGFCSATCPSYQVLGDELDSPRGRIYLMKQMLERGSASVATQQHLDRCLMCRNCESTCPSGVNYAELLEIGRHELANYTQRAWSQRAYRSLLITILSNRRLFGFLLATGRFVKSVLGSWLPLRLRLLIPEKRVLAGQTSDATTISREKNVGVMPHLGTLLLFEGCVQPSITPAISQATRQLLIAIGYEVITLKDLGCCGAIAQHLESFDQAHAQIKRNIDLLFPLLAKQKIAGIVFDATGCGLMLKEYGKAMKNSGAAEELVARADMVAKASRDVSEYLFQHLDALKKLTSPIVQKMTYHPPCSQQHGLKKINGYPDKVPELLTKLGATVVLPHDSHLCCGSAGTYSILQPVISRQLRAEKIKNLKQAGGAIVVSGNIGCLVHLSSGQLDNDQPLDIRHWVEWIAASLLVKSSLR